MQPLGLGRWVRPEVLGQPLPEPLVGGELRSLLPAGLVGELDGPVRFLIVGVVGHGVPGDGQGAAVVAELERRAPACLPRPAEQLPGRGLRCPGPRRAGLLLEQPPLPEEMEGPVRRRPGLGGFSRVEACPGLGRQVAGLVRSTPTAGLGTKRYPPRAPGIASAQSSPRRRLTRRATFSSARAGRVPPQRVSTIASESTMWPQLSTRSLSRVRPLRLPIRSGLRAWPSRRSRNSPARQIRTCPPGALLPSRSARRPPGADPGRARPGGPSVMVPARQGAGKTMGEPQPVGEGKTLDGDLPDGEA